MNELMYKFAILLSDDSPFYKSIIENEKEPLTGKGLRKKVFGVTYDSMKAWANGSKPPSIASIRKVVQHMNAYRKEHKKLHSVSKPIDVKDFYDSTNEQSLTSSSDFMPAGQRAAWLDFAIKLGYSPSQWRRVQHDIEQVFYRLGVRGHESSCSKTKAERLYLDCGGINYLYFVSPPASTVEIEDKPILLRATLRVREPVCVFSENDVHYVPCRMKTETPSRDSFKREKIEYVGKAYFKSSHMYIALLDSTAALDYAHMIVDLSKPYGSMYAGIYTSLSGNKHPYSSALVLDNREKQLDEHERVDRELILRFMYEMPKAFTEEYEEEPASVIDTIDTGDKLELLDGDQRSYIRQVLKGSPFEPPIQSFNAKMK